MDGRLDEQSWEATHPITDFTQFEPIEGAAPSQPTTVRILFGENALYVGAVLHDTEPGGIVRTLSRRDEPVLADRFWVAIDSYFDRKTAYVFGVSAAGVQIDGVMMDATATHLTGVDETGRSSTVARQVDRSWDAVWDADVSVTDTGWTVEMRIPYAMLRFSEAREQTWGVNFRREIARRSEVNDWIMIPRQETGSVRHFGRLEGLRGISPRRNVQVTPYALARLNTSPADAGAVAYDRALDVGGDLKVGLSTNVTLDATINPDFGQVEADPAVLNLTALETILPEKRPFFLEGVQIFDYDLGFFDPEGTLLYTRRVGVASSPIIGAAKLSGRTDGGLSFGAFGAATGASFDPDRFYGVGRVKQEFGGHSYLGGMLTAYRRQDGPGPVHASLAGGMDWDLRNRRNDYQLRGHLTATSISQPRTGFERRNGFGTSVTLERLRGSLTWLAALRVYDHRFDPNDLGRLRQNDWLILSGRANYLINGNRPVGPFRRASLLANGGHQWTYRTRTDLGYYWGLTATAETHGFQRISVSTSGGFGGYDVLETRGLWPYRNPVSFDVGLSFATDSRQPRSLRPAVSFGVVGTRGRSWGLDLEGYWDAGARVSLSGSVGLAATQNVAAWASNEAFVRVDDQWHIGRSNQAPTGQGTEGFTPVAQPGGLAAILAGITPFDQTAGRYYVPVFGDRDTRSADVTVRGNLTFTPTLSLQLYTQLFVAKGRFDRYGILAVSGEPVAFDAYPKRHDFVLQSFNTNLVLRWEYRPGSALYLAWSQGRYGDDYSAFPPEAGSPYATSTADRLLDTFSIRPANAFMIKLSYLFMR